MAKIKMKTRAATIGETFESFLNSRKASGTAEKTLKTYHYHQSAIESANILIWVLRLIC